MLNLIRRYPLALLGALVVHVVFVAMLVMSFDWTARPIIPAPEVDIVMATIVDERAVASELAALRQIESKKRQTEDDRVRQLETQADQARTQREREQQKLAELENQRKTELDRKHKAEQERTKAETATRQALLEQRKAEEQKAVAEADRFRVEKDRRNAEEQARKAKEEVQRAEEQRRRLDEERVAAEAEQRKRAEDEKRKNDELVRKQKEDVRRQQETQRRVEEDEQRRRQFVEEEKKLGDERAKKLDAAVASYTKKIKDKVNDNWIKSPTVREGLSCTVLVRLYPDGNVREVKVTRSSGDAVFDREVENAVKKSEPFPVPPDAEAFSRLKELQFEFKPRVK